MLFLISWLSLRRIPVVLTGITAGVLITRSGFVQRQASEALVAAYQATGEKMVDFELASLAGQLDEAHAQLGQVKGLQQQLASRLDQLQAERAAAARQLASARATLRQIAVILTQQSSAVVLVDGAHHDRRVVERDAAGRLSDCLDCEAEMQRLDATIATVQQALHETNSVVAAAERDLRVRARTVTVLESAKQARQVRRKLAALDDPSWRAQAERVSELLPESKLRPALHDRPLDTCDINERLAVYFLGGQP